METKQNKGMRKAFTMIELIFVVIIIAVIAGITIPKIMSNSTKTQISSILGSDIKSIYQAMNEWRKSSSASNGTYSAIKAEELEPYLPNNMKYVDPDGTPGNADDYISSSGYSGNVHYQIISDTLNTAGDSVKVFVDSSLVVSNQNWNNSIVMYVEDKAINLLTKYSSNPTAVVPSKLATALGGANANFTNGGTKTDGQAGVRQLAN